VTILNLQDTNPFLNKTVTDLQAKLGQ